MTNKEKFLELVSNEETKTFSKAIIRKQNRRFSRLSYQIALCILERLEDLNWSQKHLSEKMGVSPQQVNKWVKGGENFTIETIVNLEDALDIKLVNVELQQNDTQKPSVVISKSQ